MPSRTAMNMKAMSLLALPTQQNRRGMMFQRKCTAVASSILLLFAIVTPTTAGAAATTSLVMDTYVRADRATSNFGTSTRLSTDGRAYIWRNSLLRFSVQVPAGEHVVSAKLRAYSETSTSSTEFVDVFTTSGGWTERGVTWNNAPARGTWLGKTGGSRAAPGLNGM